MESLCKVENRISEVGLALFLASAVMTILCFFCGYIQPSSALVTCLFLSAVCMAEAWLLYRERLSVEDTFRRYIRREFRGVSMRTLAVLVIALTQVKKPEELLAE